MAGGSVIEECTYCGEEHEVETDQMYGQTLKTCPQVPEGNSGVIIRRRRITDEEIRSDIKLLIGIKEEVSETVNEAAIVLGKVINLMETRGKLVDNLIQALEERMRR